MIGDALVAVAAASTTAPVFDVLIPETPTAKRWAVVYADDGRREDLSLCDAGDQRVVSWQVNSFAPTASLARRLASQIRDAYLAAPVTVDGWAAAHAVHDQTVRPKPDEAARTVPLAMVTDLFTMTVTKET